MLTRMLSRSDMRPPRRALASIGSTGVRDVTERRQSSTSPSTAPPMTGAASTRIQSRWVEALSRWSTGMPNRITCSVWLTRLMPVTRAPAPAPTIAATSASAAGMGESVLSGAPSSSAMRLLSPPCCMVCDHCRSRTSTLSGAISNPAVSRASSQRPARA